MFLVQTQIKVPVSSAEIYPINLSSEVLFSHSSGCLAVGKEKNIDLKLNSARLLIVGEDFTHKPSL